MMFHAESVRFRYPGASTDALAGVSASMPSGAAVAILGPNGCGKSTLLGIFSGRFAPEEGRVLVGGEAPSVLGPGRMARLVSFLPQFERIGFAFSAFEYVLFGRSPRVSAFGLPAPADEDAAMIALDRAGAADLARRPVGELSGGELQLVRIARCLAQDTQAILMDEPTSMLDPRHTRMVADLLRKLVAEGHSIIFSTHDVAFAAYAAERAILMRGGTDLAQGPTTGILVPDLLRDCFGVDFGPSAVPAALPRPVSVAPFAHDASR